MKILAKTHLCYSFNVFKEKDNFPLSNGFKNNVKKIRSLVRPDKQQPFALGLWLNRTNLNKISRTEISALKEYLDKENLYVFSLNAFPYASFHGKKVKENVYLPDWRSNQRLQYSIDCADFLAEILPDEISGTISTVPGGYKKLISKTDLAKIADNLSKMNHRLCEIRRKKGRKFTLAIEFEPDCIWEKTEEFVEFKRKYLSHLDADENLIGICYDCSHAEIALANPEEDFDALRKENIAVSKIQLSAALECKLPEGKKYLAKFADSPYLHQSVLTENGKLKARYRDLTEMLEEKNLTGTAISHYHLPIFFSKSDETHISARKIVLEKIIKIITEKERDNENLLEIETYTHSVLPNSFPKHEKDKIPSMIAKEYAWFLSKIPHPSHSGRGG